VKSRPNLFLEPTSTKCDHHVLILVLQEMYRSTKQCYTLL